MQTYRTETPVASDGTLTIKGLPFRVGDKVEVIIRSRNHEQHQNARYPLRGKPIHYTDPFASIAEDDWDALK